MTETKLTRKQIVDELWARGNLSWKLKPHQKELYDLFYKTEHKVQTWLLARRSGKTVCLSLLAIEACIKTPNTVVKFLSPTKIMVDRNIRPIMRMLLEDCPLNIAPEFKSKDSVYYFPNGSEIQLAGSESGNYQKLRGGFSHISIVDEAQDVTDLKDAVKSVLLPTTLTTKGKILLAGTPPKAEDHEFIGFIEEAELRGSLVRKTVYDNTMLSAKDIEELKEELGGENSDEFRREMLCHILKNPQTSVIPEFTHQLKLELVKDWPKPPHYDSYESMDLGFKDLTVVLFAYYDFRADKLIVEDEICIKGEDLHLDKFSIQIKDKEDELWTNILTNEVNRPKSRVSDIDYIVLQEIARHSNNEITFKAANKYDKEASINNLRILLSNKKIMINPKCTTLIRHLENVRWDKRKGRTQFARSPDDGHYDAVDALVYLSKEVKFGKNPYPFNHDGQFRSGDIFINNHDKVVVNQLDVYKKLFNVKRRQ